MSAQQFRKKPVVIEAMQVTNETLTTVAAWCRGRWQAGLFGNGWVMVDTREGTMRADVGDWIIREPFPTDDRRFYPCKPDIFDATYEAVSS